jgi:hypothetical protein
MQGTQLSVRVLMGPVHMRRGTVFSVSSCELCNLMSFAVFTARRLSKQRGGVALFGSSLPSSSLSSEDRQEACSRG